MCESTSTCVRVLPYFLLHIYICIICCTIYIYIHCLYKEVFSCICVVGTDWRAHHFEYTSSDAQVHDGVLGFHAEAKATPLCGRCPFSAGVLTNDFDPWESWNDGSRCQALSFSLIFMTLRVQSYLYSWWVQIPRIFRENFRQYLGWFVFAHEGSHPPQKYSLLRPY